MPIPDSNIKISGNGAESLHFNNILQVILCPLRFENYPKDKFLVLQQAFKALLIEPKCLSQASSPTTLHFSD